MADLKNVMAILNIELIPKVEDPATKAALAQLAMAIHELDKKTEPDEIQRAIDHKNALRGVRS